MNKKLLEQKNKAIMTSLLIFISLWIISIFGIILIAGIKAYLSVLLLIHLPILAIGFLINALSHENQRLHLGLYYMLKWKK